MNVVFVCAYLQKLDLVPLLDLKTHLLQNLLYIIVKYHPPVLRRKHQVIQQGSDVVTLVDVLTHSYRLRPKGRGIYPP